VDDPWKRRLFLLKIATLDPMDVSTLCRGEESIGDLHSSPGLRLTATIQHLHVECLINRGPFLYKFKANGTPDGL
jgi:hypothetical protein